MDECSVLLNFLLENELPLFSCSVIEEHLMYDFPLYRGDPHLPR